MEFKKAKNGPHTNGQVLAISDFNQFRKQTPNEHTKFMGDGLLPHYIKHYLDNKVLLGETVY